MEVKVYNDDNISREDIHEVVTRVKVCLLNSNNSLLLATSDGGCQLPGGHKEEGENLIDTVIREVQEESGIILDKDEIKDGFFCIQHFTKNYENSGRNRCSEMIYFFVRTDKELNLNNLNLTENEIKNKFQLKWVKLDKVEDYVKGFINNTQKEINVIIAKEILVALEELKKYLNNN